MRHIYADSFGDEAADAIISSMMKFFLIISIGFELGFLVLRWLFCSSMIFLISRNLITTEQYSFKQLFAIVVYSEVIFILMRILNLLILYARGIDQITEPTDMNAVVGLEYFMKDKSSNFALYTLLSSINIFSLWYVSTLAIGTRTITGLTKLQSVSLACFSWLAWTTGQMAKPFLVKIVM